MGGWLKSTLTWGKEPLTLDSYSRPFSSRLFLSRCSHRFFYLSSPRIVLSLLILLLPFILLLSFSLFSHIHSSINRLDPALPLRSYHSSTCSLVATSFTHSCLLFYWPSASRLTTYLSSHTLSVPPSHLSRSTLILSVPSQVNGAHHRVYQRRSL